MVLLPDTPVLTVTLSPVVKDKTSLETEVPVTTVFLVTPVTTVLNVASVTTVFLVT